MIELKEVTRDNFWDVISLEVAPEQNEFVASNAVSIAQAKVQPECLPYAVYSDEELVGFVMYCVDVDDNEYWLYRLMIDRKHQGKGYGKEALKIVLNNMKKDKSRNKIYLGVHLESKAAVGLYESLGFKFDGQVFGSEHIMVLDY